MSTTDSFPQTGIVVTDDDDNLDNISKLAHAVFDDIVYNIVHDLVLQTHREEKMARASTAAIVVEKMAADAGLTLTGEPSAAPDTEPPKVLETPAAIYDHGKVYLKANPLKTVHEIRCKKCSLPRLLHPTDGNGARTPEPGVQYCKEHPFINKPYYDIYGQTYVPKGPGRGKKKKDMINPLSQEANRRDTPNGSQGSPVNSPTTNEAPKPIAFPHSKCQNCGTFLPIGRMSNHMAKCIGGGGRDSSRTALLKIQNGNANGTSSQNGTTSPVSRQSTPTSGRAGSKARSSPNKRSAGDDFDSDSPPQKKKMMIKKTSATKLKAPKSASQHLASNLSFEEKAPNSEDEDDDDDDDGDGEYGTVVVEPKKKPKTTMKKTTKEAERKKKWLHGKGGVKATLPPLDTTKNGNDGEDSESSQTLSSPS